MIERIEEFEEHKQMPFKHRRVLPRFRDAFRGLWQAFREEPNLRFQTFAGVLVLLAGRAVQLEGWETAYLVLTVTSVLFAEMVNTAVERTVDVAVGRQRHPLAAQAKEIAAGAVLLASLHAVFAGVFLFAVRRTIWGTLLALYYLLVDRPWLLLLPLAIGLLGWKARRSTGR